MINKINNIKIEITKGNIISQKDIQAVVNAANKWLKPGGGVAGAIHRKAGKGLYEECKKYAPIRTGETLLTSAYNLPNEYVLHCLGPIYGRDKPEDILLGKCYESSLLVADEKKIESIAYPSISTGAFGFPVKKASEIALSKIIEKTSVLKNVKTIRFVLFSDNDFEIYKNTLDNLKNAKTNYNKP